MNAIYIITRVDFDNMENRYADAIAKRVLGYALTEAQANALASKLVQENAGNMRKGWDRETYPKFEITRVERMKP